MRQIFEINATQVVTSESHPEGVRSTVQGYPKTVDSRNYGATEENPNGSEERALIMAQAEFADTVKNLSLAQNRAMWTVTLIRADGRMMDWRTWGSFPDMNPPAPNVG